MNRTLLALLTLGASITIPQNAHAGGHQRQAQGLPLDPSVQAMVAAVSADTMFSNLETLVGFHTRHTNSDTTSGTVGIGAARRWIYAQFQRYASNPPTMQLLPSYFTFTETVCGITGENRNVLAILPGMTTPDRNFIVMGHMDSRNESNCDNVGYAPGANDDCSGTVVAMEMARVISPYPLESTLTLMPVTGEEQGLFGSTAYAEFALQQGMRIDGALTNDVVGNIEGCVDPSCPPGSEMIIDSLSVRDFSGDPATGNSRQLARYLKLQGERYLSDFTVNLIPALDRPGRSGDHVPFYDRGFAAARLTEAHENGDGSGTNGRQHNMNDTISPVNTNQGYMARIAQLTIAGFASLSRAPETPQGLEVYDVGDGQGAYLTWPLSHTEPDFSGYMIAMRDPDSLYYEAYYDAGQLDHYTVNGLTMDEAVYFSLGAYDSTGNLSIFSDELFFTPSSLPRVPSNVDATSYSGNVTLTWDANLELDIAAYRIYRSTMRNSGFVLYDSVLSPTVTFIDGGLSPHTKYFYQIHAVDASGNESPASPTVAGQLVTHDLGILVVDDTKDGTGTVLAPTDAQVDDQYSLLLQGFSVGGQYDLADSALLAISLSDADFAPYSTVLWHTDVRGSSPIYQDTSSLRKYLQNGGNLFISGWKLSASLMYGAVIGRNTYPAGTFVPGFLKVDSTFTSGALTQDFMEAIGSISAYPDIPVDSARIPLYNGTLVNTDVVLPPFADGSAEVLYTHHGNVPGSMLEGKPVGWRYFGPDYKVVVFDFPLYYMEIAEAAPSLEQALIDLGEPTSVEEGQVTVVPRNFQLHQNFPNPFNPSTEILLELSVESKATVVIYDVLGQKVRTLLNEERAAGISKLIWDGRSDDRRPVSSGMYFYSLKAVPTRPSTGSYFAVKRMLLIR